MAEPRTVLPPSSTTLERVIDTTLQRDWGVLSDAVQPLDMNAHADMQPWIAQHWQLGRLDRYLSAPGDLLAQGLPWLRERGTAAGVRRALGWLGYEHITIEEDGALLHLDVGRPVGNSALAPIAGLMRETLPVHVRFYRMFHGDDLRVARYDLSRWDGALWDDDSGQFIEIDGEEPVKVVQREGHTVLSGAPWTIQVLTMAYGLRHTSVTSADTLAYDSWTYDGEVMGDIALGSAGIISTLVPEYLRLVPFVFSTEVHGTACAWDAPDAQLFGLGMAITSAPPATPLDDSRTWVGVWDSGTWAVVCPTITTRLD